MEIKNTFHQINSSISLFFVGKVQVCCKGFSCKMIGNPPKDLPSKAIYLGPLYADKGVLRVDSSPTLPWKWQG